MIATRVEDALRQGLYGVFWKRFDPLETEVWHAQLIQCIEKNVRVHGSQCFMPDRYLVSLQSDITLSKDGKRQLLDDIQGFIRDFTGESGYILVNNIRVDFITKKKNIFSGIEFYGWVSNSAQVHAEIWDLHDTKVREQSVDLTFDEKYLVGRTDKAGIQLTHPCISYYHAQLIVDIFGRVHIKDLQSTNGTYLQGKRLVPFRDYVLNLPAAIYVGGLYDIEFVQDSGSFRLLTDEQKGSDV